MKTTLKVTTVGEGGTFILPLPINVMEELGWKDGDVLDYDIGFPGDILILWQEKKKKNV